jgi:integrase/recombinase XerD
VATASVTTPAYQTLKPAPTVSLYLRDSNHYYKPVVLGNHKLRPLYGLVNGVPQKFEKGVYCLRYRANGVGKRTWEPVGKEPQQALVAKGKKELALHAQVNDMLGRDKPVRVTLLTGAGAEYLAETLAKVEGKQLARSTFTAYRRVVNTFLVHANADTFEQVTRTMILSWIAWLQGERGLAEYTVEKRVDMLKIFFSHFEAKWPLKDKDKPTHTPSPAKPYLKAELNLLLQHGTVDEIDAVMFLYGTGGRKGEVQHAYWTDVNWERAIFCVTEKRTKKRSKKTDAEDWRSKDGEEGEIPVDPILMERLHRRRERYPDSRLIFPGKRGKPNCDLLTIVKQLALKAGVNCGQCVNKHGHSCESAPCCERVICHRFRKSFATLQHEAGASTRTIQKWLRHSDLETTEGYIAPSANDLPEVREKVNRAFSHLAVPNA